MILTVIQASPSLDVQSIGDSASASGSKHAVLRRHSTNDNEGYNCLLII